MNALRLDLLCQLSCWWLLVDSAQLAVKTMMYNQATHPANFVEFDHHTGMAKTAFHCMIIGFGETGQKAFS